MDSVIQHLMDDDEVHDALTAYHTDSTTENKRRVIETILAEADHAPKPSVEPGPHRIIFVPSVASINSAPTAASISGEIDQTLRTTAIFAKRVGEKIHEAGSSAVYVRFDSEWYDHHIPTLWGFYQQALEAESLDNIDSFMRAAMRKVGNLPDAFDAEVFYKMLNRYVAEGEYDGCLRSIARMVDTKFTRNLPKTVKPEIEEEGEEE